MEVFDFAGRTKLPRGPQAPGVQNNPEVTSTCKNIRYEFLTGIAAGALAEDTIPGQPQLVDVAYTSPTSAMVSWFPPADQSVLIRGYRVEYGKKVPEENQIETDARTLKVELTDLEPNMKYVIKVLAFNNRGIGMPVYILLEPTDGGDGGGGDGEYINQGGG